MRKPIVTVLAAAAIVAGVPRSLTSQAPQPPTLATDVTAEQIQAVLNAPEGGGDRQIRVVDMGKYNVAVGVLRRGPTKPGAPVSGINHTQVTEVYYIISGGGTLVTGGKVENIRPLAADAEVVKVAVGPSNNGTFVEPAQSRRVKPGDVVIIPPGVFHGFSEVADHVHYVSIRPDADHVLPAGYVHPALKAGRTN